MARARRTFPRDVTVLFVTVACIGAGAVAEATFFRIAKFDEIDFCSQSLGAVLAGLAATGFNANEIKASNYDVGLIAGIVFLGIGGCFAVA
jgi:hypothetical protein